MKYFPEVYIEIIQILKQKFQNSAIKYGTTETKEQKQSRPQVDDDSMRGIRCENTEPHRKSIG
jgi:hypothetical protein